MNQTKVTQEQIDALFDQAEQQEYVFFGKNYVLCVQLSNGFTVTGEGSCVDPANFNLEIGRRIATQKIKSKLWELEGYLLQQRLFEAQ
jgi:hypothetical protein